MTLLKKYTVIVLLIFLSATLLHASSGVRTDSIQPAETVRQIDPESIVSKIMNWYEHHMNYGSIAFLMALESSFIPIPSEIVLFPAAYIASDPSSDLNFILVILFASLGSLTGALIIYALSLWAGRKALYRFADSKFGSFLMIDSDKIRHAEEVFRKRSKVSICLGRFVAGIRLVISIPAGLSKMNLFNFIFYTFIGSVVYNTALGLIGYLLQGQADLIYKYSYQLSVATIILAIVALFVFAVRYFLLRRKGIKVYGLLGYPLGHSFSKRYFSEKFKKEKINARYKLFETERIEDIKRIVKQEKVRGLSVTIPYKEKIIAYTDELDDTAAKIGAVNVLKIKHFKTGVRMKGYNTDIIGFENSITPHLKPHHRKALILGTGGASKAVEYVLRKLDIKTIYVSRNEKPGAITYASLNREAMEEYPLIVNATPLGTFPNVDTCPDIPYQYLTAKHLLFDLVYNPAETLFLKKGKERGCNTVNGEQMLTEQAEAAWKLWDEED